MAICNKNFAVPDLNLILYYLGIALSALIVYYLFSVFPLQLVCRYYQKSSTSIPSIFLTEHQNRRTVIKLSFPLVLVLSSSQTSTCLILIFPSVKSLIFYLGLRILLCCPPQMNLIPILFSFKNSKFSSCFLIFFLLLCIMPLL